MITSITKGFQWYISVCESLGKDFAKLLFFFEKKKSQDEFSLIKNHLQKKDETHLKKFSFDSIIEKDRSLLIGDKHHRIFYLADLPPFVFYSTIFKLINLPIPLTFSYHIKDTNKALMIRACRARLSVLESSKNSDLKKNKNPSPELVKEIEELTVYINDLVYDKEKSFLLSLYIEIRADTNNQLIEFSKVLQDAGSDLEFVFNTYSFAQKKALDSIMPICNDSVKESHLLQTSAMVNLLPFLSRNLNDPSGIFFGVDHFTNSLILLDIFKARNANINIFGTSGSGKSVTAKLLMMRFVLRGVQNLILDPEGEYVGLTKALKGKVYQFDSNNGIDPFLLLQALDCEKADLVQIIKHFLKFFIQDKNYDMALLDELIVNFIKSKSIQTFNSFFIFVQKKLGKSNGIVVDLKQLITGSLAGLYTNSTNINLSNQIICFDLSLLKTDEQKLPLMYLLGNVINKLLDLSGTRRMVFIDEAHKFIKDKNNTDFYVNLVKTARKRKAGVVTITQNPEDFKESDNSKTIITQAETTILLKQAAASINFINRFGLFKLSDRECTDLSVFGVGEALFIREKEHIYIDIFPFKSERELVFT